MVPQLENYRRRRRRRQTRYQFSIQEWFEQFGPVFAVTVCLNNGVLLNLYKKRAQLEHHIKLEAIEETKFARLTRSQSSRSAKVVPRVRKHARRLLRASPAHYTSLGALFVFSAVREASHGVYRCA